MSDYAYANARARARHAGLFSLSFLGELSGQDISHIIRALETSSYGTFISEAVLAKPTPHGVDEALHKSMAKDFRDFLAFLDGDGQNLLGVVLGIWDVYNIKTILRGKHVGVTVDEILSNLIPAGELDFSTLTELARESDVVGVINLLATWRIPYARPLSSMIKEYSETTDLAFLEKALDEYFYNIALDKASMRGQDAALVRDLLTERIDLINLLTLARCVNEGVSRDTARNLFIRDGMKFKVERLTKAVDEMQDIGGVIDFIASSRYGRALAPNIADQVKDEGLPPLERALERYLFEKGIGLYGSDPLGLGIILGYLFSKWNEVINLRIIIRGKWVGMPIEKIREALILV